MAELELQLDYVNRYGQAVFRAAVLEPRWYIMKNADDGPKLFDPRKYRIQHPKGIEAAGYEREKIFKRTDDAIRYVKAVARFNYLVWFIGEFFNRDYPEIPLDLKKEAVEECKLKIREGGLRQVLEEIPELKDAVRFLDMPPEEVASELWKNRLSRV